MEPWHDPAIVRRYEKQQRRRQGTASNSNDSNCIDTFDTSVLLSHIPWRIRYKKAKNDDNNDGSMVQSNGNHNETATTFDSSSDATGTVKLSTFPSWSYVDIRRKQNLSFARQQLEQGAQLAKLHQQSQTRNNAFAFLTTADEDLDSSSYYDKAKQCYDDGLQMCPDYAPLWVALGALEANAGHYSKAETHLQHALSLDINTPNAEEYLQAIQQQQQRKVKKSAWVERSEMARQNVALEQAMMMSSQQHPQAQPPSTLPIQNEELLSNDDTKPQHKSSDIDEDAMRGQRRRGRRRNDRSDLDDDDGDESERRHERHRRRRRRRRHDEERRHHKKHRRSSYDSPDNDDEDIDPSEDESQRLYRRQMRRSEERVDSKDIHEGDADMDRRRRRDRRRKRRRKRDDEDRYAHRKRRKDASDGDHSKDSRRQDPTKSDSIQVSPQPLSNPKDDAEK